MFGGFTVLSTCQATSIYPEAAGGSALFRLAELFGTNAPLRYKLNGVDSLDDEVVVPPPEVAALVAAADDAALVEVTESELM